MRSVHCATNTRPNLGDSKSVNDGLWTTLLGTASTSQMKAYISQSKVCMEKALPAIAKGRCKEYELSQSNQIRSMRILYEGGLIGKRKYTSIRNSCDIIQTGDKRNRKNQIMEGCEIPKIVPFKTLIKYVNSIDIGEVVDLQTLATKLSVESALVVYRPLKPFLLRLVDLYLMVDIENPSLKWFNNEKSVIYVAIRADAAPLGKDDNATSKYPFNEMAN